MFQRTMRTMAVKVKDNEELLSLYTEGQKRAIRQQYK